MLLPQRGAQRGAPGSALLSFSSDVKNVLDAETAVATVGQATEREHAVLAEPINELARDTEDVSSLRGSDLILGTQHEDPRAVGHVVEHRAHCGLKGSVAGETPGQVPRVGPDRGVDWVEGRRERSVSHVDQPTRNCNNSNLAELRGSGYFNGRRAPLDPGRRQTYV